jgi:hypothetical protein
VVSAIGGAVIIVTFPVHVETPEGEQTWAVTMESAWRRWSFVSAVLESANGGFLEVSGESVFLEHYTNDPYLDLEGLAQDAWDAEHGDDDTIEERSADAHSDWLESRRDAREQGR